MTTVRTHKTGRGQASRYSPAVVIGYVLIVIYSLALLVPLYWLMISSFKSTTQILTNPFLPSFGQGLKNFTNVWNDLDLGDSLINSLYITGSALILTVVLAVPAAYALARSTGRTAVWVERLYGLGFLIPTFAALVPTLLLAIALNLYATREFMILFLPASSQPLAVILLTQFMRAVPSELEESARMDGAGRLRILRSVYIPLTLPGIATVLILNFIGFWNEYLFTLIIVTPDASLRTVQVALPTLAVTTGYTDFGALTAGTFLSIIPVFVVYAILNRRMENALIQGAVKG